MQSASQAEEAIKQLAARGVMQVAQVQEEQLDQELRRLEELDEDDFERLRQQRVERMRKAHLQKQEWLRQGHGVYHELASQQEFFDCSKRSKQMVVHFYRPTTARCEIVDAHLERLAPRHPETRLCRINAEKAPFLVERLNVFMMPTMVLVKNGEAFHHLRGFDELGGSDDFSTQDLAFVLSNYDVLKFEGDRSEYIESRTQGRSVNRIRMAIEGDDRSNPIRDGSYHRDDDNEDDDDEY